MDSELNPSCVYLVESNLADDVTVKQGRVIGSKDFKALPVTKFLNVLGLKFQFRPLSA